MKTNANVIGTVVLNLYMIYRQVSWTAILVGLGMVFALNCHVDRCSKKADLSYFEFYHPFCHYIAGFYVAYCVFFIEQSFL